MVSFGELLQAYIDKQDMSHRTFAAAVGVGHALISFIVKGERSCPLKDLDAWMDALEVPPDQRPTFREAAVLTHATKEVREYIDGLHAQIKKLERK